jgi:hypothetical protein
MEQATKDAAAALTERMNTALDTAKEKLKDAQSAFDDFGSSVSEGIKSSFSFADAKTFGDETGSGFITGLAQQVGGIYQYSEDIKTLLARGLSQESLQAVLAAGGKSGAAIARELVLGAQDDITGPQGVNAFVTTLNDFATTLGIGAANKWYSVGVSNAQSYLDGIQAAFNFAQSGLAVPGLNVADVKGIGAAFDAGVTSKAANPISPRSFNDSFGGIGGFFDGVTVNVNGGISTSAEIGEAVVNAIRAYNRAAGPANIAVA